MSSYEPAFRPPGACMCGCAPSLPPEHPPRQAAVRGPRGSPMLNQAACLRSRSDQMTLSAVSKWSISASLCSGAGVRRSRSVSRGTVG